ncbi:Severe Depolymerization of Actin [Malassezia sp. CBS 17886]|nr:Severe Depolymerization of Actin [Malassezia sp. CBS 17886]
MRGGGDRQGHATAVVRDNGLRHRSKARGLLDTSNLPALQNLLKRDPAAYTDEFLAQWNHYESLRRIYASGIGQAMEGAGDVALPISKDQQLQFEQLLSFVTHLAPSYPEVTTALPEHLAELLLAHHASLTPDMRRMCVRALVMLRTRGVVSSETLLRTLFPLLTRTTSSELRKSLLHMIVQDLKLANKNTANPRLNRMVQGLLFGMVERGMSSRGADGAPSAVLRRSDAELTGRTEALWAVRVAAEMWRRRIWTDAHIVALLALACTHPHPKVQASAVRFLLGDLHAAESTVDGSDSEQEDGAATSGAGVRKLQHQRKVGKKTKAGERRLKLAEAQARRRRKEHSEKALDQEDHDTSNMAAVHLLHDPQDFAERLFENLSRGDKRHALEMKVRLMQLLSRVIGAHRLCVLPYYSYLSKYLQPHQLHITLILVALAQSVHDQTPTDMLTPTIRKIANAFVHPGVGAEVVAAGINTVREVCRRQPWCMEADLLEDLVAYRRSKDKGVSAAARGLMQLYREVNPAMLRRVERGKTGSLAVAQGQAAAQFGVDRREVRGIQGLDLLEKHLEESGAQDADAHGEWDGWELQSDTDSDSSRGWVNVSSDEEGGHFSVDGSELGLDDGDGSEPGLSGHDGDEAPGDAAHTRVSARVREARLRRKVRRREHPVDRDEPEHAEVAPAAADAPVSALATTKILTPADFAKLNELRVHAAEDAAKASGAAGATARRDLSALKLSQKRLGSGTREVVDESDILGPRKKAKADHEERMQSINSGREDRGKFGSRKGKKNKEVASSTTNRQKARSKNFQMISKSWSVRNKKNASLRDKSKRLRKHVTQMKKRTK